ncbi:MAG: DNA mismatch repair protein MutS [Spirochaetaceae bacterium]|nr:DNA mismatch repair protein MutS [Spirochaetaceae bacterium]
MSQQTLTPIMQQYYALKHKYTDTILFFRLGDFYEMFDDDAKVVSNLIGLTLTNRQGHAMCGVPYHASETYVAKLLEHGLKIAICEQLGQNDKGIASRDVVEVITPGSVLNPNLLSENANYMAAISFDKVYSFAYLDLSTSEFVALATPLAWQEWLPDELDKLKVRELIINEELFDELSGLTGSYKIVPTRYPAWLFNHDSALNQLKKQFTTANLRSFGFNEDDEALKAAGALLEYTAQITRQQLPHINKIKRRELQQGLLLNQETRASLELVQNNYQASFTLFNSLNYCTGAMGSRLLKHWLLNPLYDKKLIEERLNRLTFLTADEALLNNLRAIIKKSGDLQRLSSRLAMDKAHAKDLLAIAGSLTSFIQLNGLLTKQLDIDDNKIETINDIILLINKTLADDPPVSLNEGGLIKTGFLPQLDELRALATDGRSALESYAEEERTATGVNLRLKENRVIGYFFEVNKNNADKLPPYFIRRQSMVTGERFSTSRLRELQDSISHAHEKAISMERGQFLLLRDELKTHLNLFYEVAALLALWDTSGSLALIALKYNYVKPIITNDIGITIKAGRHPVIEQNLTNNSFVANDFIATAKNRSLLITAPNMAGKSTYLKQNALIVLMAQMGSFVSADEATIGLVDQIFCRVGASDNLAKGESTFMVEMLETAKILQQATNRSLVIMDEVGRGTSSDDGLAIARAVLEELTGGIKAITLFATHYHELTRLLNVHIKNFTLRVLEENKQIYFLKELTAGAAKSSYGTHVARLAGIPDNVAAKAEGYLAQLIEDKANKRARPANQSLLFSDEAVLREVINKFNVSTATPLEALNFIAKLQQDNSTVKQG